MQINEEKYQYIKDGIPVTRTKPNGETEEVKAKAAEKEPETIEDLFSEDEEIPFPEEKFFAEEAPTEESEAEPSEEDLRTKRDNFIDLLMGICNELKDDT